MLYNKMAVAFFWVQSIYWAADCLEKQYLNSCSVIFWNLYIAFAALQYDF